MKTPQEIYARITTSRFAGNVAATFGTRILLTALGFATTVIVTRILGPEGRGLYAIALALSAAGVQFGNMGLQSSNTYYVAGNRHLLPRLLGNTMVISFVVGLVVALGIWLVSLRFPGVVEVKGKLLSLALIGVPVGLLFLLLENLLLGLEDVRSFNFIEMANKVLFIVFVTLFIWKKQVSPSWIVLCGVLAMMVCDAAMFRNLTAKAGAPLEASRQLFKETIGYGGKVYIATLFSFLISRMDLFLINRFSGLADAGVYSVAASIADLVSMIPIVVGSILFPKLSAQKDFHTKRNMTFKAALVSTAVTTAAIAALAFSAEFLIPLLFGPKFEAAAKTLEWLLFGLLLLPAANAAGQLVSAIGYSYWYMFGWPIAMLVKLPISYILISKAGYIYVGLGNAMVALITLAFALISLRGVDNAEAFNG